MANVVKPFPAESGKFLYLFPDVGYGLSLSQWEALKAEATEQASPNLGKYIATLDDTYELWMVFEGEDQPTDWNQWVDIVSLYVGLTTLDVEELRYRVGLSGEATAPVTENIPSVLEIPPGNLEERISTGYAVCVSSAGAIEEGVTVSVQMVAGPGDDGYSYHAPVRRTISDEDGVVLFEGMIRGATYLVWRGKTAAATRKKTAVVPSEDVFELPETI